MKADATREILNQIRADNGGVLTPGAVLEAARSEGHPLHSRFDWDDSVAAEKWRLQQAHDVIVSVKIVKRRPDESSLEVRAFQAVRGEAGYSYEPSEEVARNPFTRTLVLKDMEREWRQLRRRYDTFAEFWPMVQGDADAA